MIFSRKTYQSSGSPGKLAWLRFRKNVPGMISLSVILLTLIIAILGYLVTPDHSPYANDQRLEISTQKPGFSIEMLKIRKNRTFIHTSFFKEMLTGSEGNYTKIPVSSCSFEDDSITATIFDPDNLGLKKSWNIADFVYPLATKPVKHNDSLVIHTINGKTLTVSIEGLRSVIKKQNFTTQRFWLGTDQFGRDLLSRLIIGSRVSISVGFISVGISLIVGLLLGSLAGYFRGRTDDVIMWFINVVWSIPTLLLVIAITFALGRGFWQIFVAVGLTMWVEVARVVRGQIISIKEKEFVEAGKALGFTGYRIISRHILPNVISPVIVISAANFAAAILIEAGLSFLGIGVQPPVPSWGGMIREYYSFIILNSAYLAVIPGLAIVLLVLAFMTLGNALRDVLDVKTLEK